MFSDEFLARLEREARGNEAARQAADDASTEGTHECGDCGAVSNAVRRCRACGGVRVLERRHG